MLIGLVGYKGSGKSTVARILCTDTQEGFVRYRFAGPLKDMLHAFYRSAGLTSKLITAKIDGELKEEPCEFLNGRTPRYAMQTLGTEWGRDLVHPSLWLDHMRRRIKHADGAGFSIVIDDARFPNEFEMISEVGGLLWRVDRPGIEVDLSHPSEAHVDAVKPDLVILNDGSLELLREKVVGRFKL